MDDLVVADLEEIRHSKRWGSSWSQWGNPNEPSAEIQFYSPTSGKATITIETEDGKKMQEIIMDVLKGVNVYNYDLTLTEKGVKNLKKAGTEVKKGANDKFYLPKGKYSAVVKNHSKLEKIVLTIK